MSTTAEEKTQDLRIRRTHKLLVDALKSLLMEQPFDEIHITDICERAMVHRTTFYKHFLDKYDLLSFALKDLQRSFDEKNKPAESVTDARKYFLNFFQQVLEYMAEHKKMYVVGLKQLKSDMAMKILFRSVTDNIQSKLENYRQKGAQYRIPTDILAEFYVGGLFSMANWWIEREMPISVSEMVRYADIMIVNDHFLQKEDGDGK